MLPIDQVGEMLEMIAPEKKISFDKNYAEEVYRQYNESKSVDDTLVIEELTKAFAGKRILLIGPGKSIIDANEKINKLVSATDVITIGLNTMRLDNICLVLSGISYILDVLDVPRLPWNFGTAMMAVLFIEIGFQINKMDILNKLKYQGCGVQIFVCIIILFSATIGIILNPVEIVEFSANNYGSFILMIMGSVSASFLLMFFANIVGSSTASAKALTYLGRHTLFLMSFDYFSDFISVRVLQIFRVHNWLFSFCGKVLVLVIGLQLLQLAIKVIPNESAKKFLSKY